MEQRNLKKTIFKKKELVRKDFKNRELKRQGIKKKDLKKKELQKKNRPEKTSDSRKHKDSDPKYSSSKKSVLKESNWKKTEDRREEKRLNEKRKNSAAGRQALNTPARGGRNTARPSKAAAGRGERLKNRTEGLRNGSAPSLRIIPLGGLEQIGMNITAFEYGDSIVVVDCGLAFPEDDMLGIDLVIPDTTYLEENIDKVRAFVITPFGDVVELGEFDVEFIKTNHSIVDAAALAITSPAGTIVHTGDFKVDYTPVYGDAIDLQRFAQLGDAGVLALMCDSTNSERPGHTPSEKMVGRSIDQIFRDHADTRIIVATFASNVDRVQQIINHAYKYGRKVVVEGRSMVNIIETATRLDVLNVPDNTLIDIEQLKNYPGEKTVIITTGSQGESMAALSRMADGLHRKVTIGPGDTVVFSSSPIPGNEKAVTAVVNKLLMKGADVITQDVHASGHPCQEDVKLIYNLVQPRYAIPVHGEYRHLKAQAKIARELGYDKEDIFILRSGDVLEISEDEAFIREKVQVGNILVDGLGVGDVGNVVLRDRQHLAEDGIVIVAFALESGSCQLLSGPEITSRGFVYIKESDDLMTGAAAVAEEAIYHCIETGVSDWNRYKNAVKDSLNDFFWKKTQRRPVILPMILEV